MLPEEDRQAQLAKLGLQDFECYQFGSLFRDLAAYLTQLSSKRVSEQEAEEIQKKLLAKKALIGITQPTKAEIQETLIESLQNDVRVLEFKKIQLELLKSAIDADTSNVNAQIAKIEALIDYIQHN